MENNELIIEEDDDGEINENTYSSSDKTISSEGYQHESLINRKTTNIESHQLIWVSSNNKLVSVESLRNIVDYTRLFENINDCRSFIEQTFNTTTFIVCSQALAQRLISQIHDFKNIYLIYIYTSDQNTDTMTTAIETSIHHHQQWISSCKKVKSVYTNIDQLFSDLSKDVQTYLKHEINDMHIFWTKFKLDDRSMDEPESSWISLIDFWIHLPYPEHCLQRFVHTLKSYYNGSNSKIKVLENFECDYNRKNAIQWYTQETFLYSIFNRTLREHNIRLMFLFGFLLQDIYRQLKEEYNKMRLNQTKTKLTLFRGQTISGRELRSQRNPLAPSLFGYNETKMINNSLFSTTLNRSLAMIYVNQNLDHRDINSDQSILIEIEVNMEDEDEDSYYRRPFANISHLSQFDNEDEILFMPGTTFRYDREAIQYDLDEHVWRFKLEMDNNNSKIYENQLDCSCRRKSLKRCIVLLTQSNRKWWNTIALPELKILFKELYKIFPKEATWISAMKNHCFGIYQQFKENKYKKALTYYYKALNLWSSYQDDVELICLYDHGDIHYQIAYCFNFELKNLEEAKLHYEQSIHFYQLAISGKFDLSCYERIQVYKELAIVYERRSQFNDNQISYELSKIKYREFYFETAFKYYSPKQTIEIWPILELIAESYEYIGETDKAISYYETALALREGLSTLTNYSKITYPFHNIEYLINIYRSLIKLYMNYKQNYVLALNYRLILYEYELQWERGHRKNGIEQEKQLLAHKYSDLADIYKGLHQYSLALSHLQLALSEYKGMESPDSIEWDIVLVDEKIKELRKLLS